MWPLYPKLGRHLPYQILMIYDHSNLLLTHHSNHLLTSCKNRKSPRLLRSLWGLMKISSVKINIWHPPIWWWWWGGKVKAAILQNIPGWVKLQLAITRVSLGRWLCIFCLNDAWQDPWSSGTWQNPWMSPFTISMAFAMEPWQRPLHGKTYIPWLLPWCMTFAIHLWENPWDTLFRPRLAVSSSSTPRGEG